MGLILPWSTVYPGAIDDNITNFPTLTDNVHDVIASHQNAVATAVIALEQESFANKENWVVTGATDEDEDQLDVERVIGGFMFNGENITATNIAHLRAIGVYNANGGAVQGDLRVRLYDMGVPGAPIAPSILRATVSIPNANEGDISKAQLALTTSAGPGVDSGEIHNSLRSYELRVIQDGMDAAATSKIHWAGMAIGITQ
jgi:hypothetical protein